MTRTKTYTVIAVIVAAVLAVGLWRAATDDPSEPAAAPQDPTTSAVATPTPSTPPTTEPGGSAPADPAKPIEQADAVAALSMTVAHTWKPATDAGPSDGFRRAARWFTPELNIRLNTNDATTKGPGAQWDGWKREGAEIYAVTQPGCSGCPPDTDTTAHRVVAVNQTAVTATGSTEVDPALTVWLTLTKRDGTWLVDDLHY